MSLERNIQELHQAVTMLTKSIDLQTATIAEATAELLQAVQNRQTSAVKAEAAAEEAAVVMKKGQAEAEVEKAKKKKEQAKKEEAPAELTDDEIKASPIYKTIQDKMSQHYGAALAANGGDQKAAREDTLKILKTYADDGKVLSLVRVILEDEEAGAEVMEELLGVYDTAIAALQDASDSNDEGEEEEERTYTADDVKAALRAYAKIEGRPAAIMKLQQLTGGKSEVKAIPEDQYAAVIAGLKADM